MLGRLPVAQVGLVEGGQVGGDGLTPADAAYLTALYATDPEAKKMAQESDITARMTKMLTAAPSRAGR